jgi:mannose-6-phosphate isomerase-like protein (cupin superfamily)
MAQMTKYTINDIGGEVVKDNETYLLKDNKKLKNLVLSSTDLKPNKSTRGHKHEGQEEVYYFVEGHGDMEIDGHAFAVYPGDVVLIEDGAFHRVRAGPNGMYFVCVFDGKRNH